MRIIFLGHREIASACLRSLISDSTLKTELVIVHTDKYCQDCTPILNTFKQLSQEHEFKLIQTDHIYTAKTIIEQIAPELAISVGYMGILPSEIFDLPKFGMINLHAGKLPKYRGRAPIPWALINGETEIGVTIHRIATGIDSGDVILQESIPVALSDTSVSLYEKVKKISPALLKHAVRQISKHGYEHAVPQDTENIIYFPNLPPEVGRIDWQQPSLSIHNLVRALVPPYPGAFTYWNEKKVFIWETILEISPKYVGLPGHILSVEDSEYVVKTGDSRLRIRKLSFSSDDSGARPKRGDIFGR